MYLYIYVWALKILVTENHHIFNLMGFLPQNLRLFKIKHLLVNFKTINAVLLAMI